MERGNHRRPRSRVCCGANPARDAGSADLARASPSANPVGSTQGGLVQLKRVFVAVLCVLGLGVGAAVPAAANTGGAMPTEPAQPAVIQEVACVARCTSL